MRNGFKLINEGLNGKKCVLFWRQQKWNCTYRQTKTEFQTWNMMSINAFGILHGSKTSSWVYILVWTESPMKLSNLSQVSEKEHFKIWHSYKTASTMFRFPRDPPPEKTRLWHRRPVLRRLGNSLWYPIYG